MKMLEIQNCSSKLLCLSRAPWVRICCLLLPSKMTIVPQKIRSGFFCASLARRYMVWELCLKCSLPLSLVSMKQNLWIKIECRDLGQTISCKYFPDSEFTLVCTSFVLFFTNNVLQVTPSVLKLWWSAGLKNKTKNPDSLEIPQILRKSLRFYRNFPPIFTVCRVTTKTKGMFWSSQQPNAQWTG